MQGTGLRTHLQLKTNLLENITKRGGCLGAADARQVSGANIDGHDTRLMKPLTGLGSYRRAPLLAGVHQHGPADFLKE